MTTDLWGQPLTGATPSATSWDRAWGEFLHFRGDPMATLAEANETDPSFVVGPVFCAAYRILGGAPSDLAQLQQEVEWARTRSERAGERDRRFVHALEQMVIGEFSAAARAWDTAARGTRDLPALRLAHDVYLHVGDADGRLASSTRAIAAWSEDDPGHSFVLGQHAFALEEAAHYDEAEEVGLLALDRDADDLWARHALAHVYESTDQQDKAIQLLRGEQDRWRDQDLLANHVWWHLALRLLSVGDTAGVLAIYDDLEPVAKTAFRLCDLTSLLWRLELTGADVGGRWDHLADAWAGRVERHTCGFLDLHAALTFTRRPHHRGAEPWFAGLAAAHADSSSENAETFRTVVRPLSDAMVAFGRGCHEDVVAGLGELGPATSRVGGSVAQRDLIELTLAASRAHLFNGEPETEAHQGERP